MPPTTLRRRRHLTAGAVALALVVSACSSSGDDGADADADATVVAGTDATPAPDGTPADTAPSGDPTTEPMPTTGTDAETTAPDVVVPEALRFTAPLVGGGEFDGASYAGTPTVFWFWAPT